MIPASQSLSRSRWYSLGIAATTKIKSLALWGTMAALILGGCRIADTQRLEEEMRRLAQSFAEKVQEYRGLNPSQLTGSSRTAAEIAGGAIALTRGDLSVRWFLRQTWSTSSPVGSIETPGLHAVVLDELSLKLPEGIRAHAPDDLRTVILTQWYSTVVGHYSNGWPARKVTCTVYIVDHNSKSVLARKDFAGTDPSAALRPRSGAGSAYGKLPLDEILAWITGRLRRG